MVRKPTKYNPVIAPCLSIAKVWVSFECPTWKILILPLGGRTKPRLMPLHSPSLR